METVFIIFQTISCLYDQTVWVIFLRDKCNCRQTRIRELERRIKQHTSLMHERRKLPKGTPQEEMEAARRELEIVSTVPLLHRDRLPWLVLKHNKSVNCQYLKNLKTLLLMVVKDGHVIRDTMLPPNNICLCFTIIETILFWMS